MIIDADVHVSPVPLPGGSITAEALRRMMDRAGVDKALTWLQPAYLRQLEESKAYVSGGARTCGPYTAATLASRACSF